MAEDETIKEETFSRGNEWEVVTLTASAYAANPGSKEIPLIDGSKDKNSARNELEFSRSMFMSGHFLFPPSEHENLPIQPNNYIDQSEVEVGIQEVQQRSKDEGSTDKNQEEIWNLKALSEPRELLHVEPLEKENRLFGHDTTFEESKEFQGVDLIVDEEATYNDLGFSSFHRNVDIVFDDNSEDANRDGLSSPHSSDASHDPSEAIESSKERKSDRIPCETWWRRQSASLYAQAKEANTFWSILVAAALLGMVIIGKRWQQEKWQIQQLKWKSSNHDMKICQVVSPMNRFKNIFIGANRRGLGGISSLEH